MIYSELDICQHETFDFIKDLDYWGAFLGFGIGKTLVALSYIEYRGFKKSLVIGSKQVVIEGDEWPKQITQHTDFSYITMANKTEKQRKELINSNAKIHLINYDSVESSLADLINGNYEFVVLDESTAIKNVSTVRFRKLKKLSQAIPHRGIMTGHPITENYLNLWPQIYFLDHGQALGDNFWSYMNKYFYKFMYDWHPKKEIQEKIIDKIKDFCISRRTHNCLDLPRRKNIFYPLDMTSKQEKYCDELVNTFSLTKGSFVYEAQSILPIYSKLKQVCSGFMYSSQEVISKSGKIIKAPEIESVFRTPKDEVLLEILASLDIEDKVLIWVEFKQEIDKLEKLLADYRTCVVYHGRHTTADIDNYDIVLTTPKLYGRGSTVLTRYAVRYAHDWSFELFSNSKARNYRRGSEKFKDVTYIDIYMKKSIEESIIKNRSKKNSMVRAFQDYLERRGS